MDLYGWGIMAGHAIARLHKLFLGVVVLRTSKNNIFSCENKLFLGAVVLRTSKNNIFSCENKGRVYPPLKIQFYPPLKIFFL